MLRARLSSGSPPLMPTASTGTIRSSPTTLRSRRFSLRGTSAHKETPSEEFAHEVEVAHHLLVSLFIGFIGVWIARRTYKFAHSQEN